MKEKLSWFEKIMAAVTFAEANLHDAGKFYLTGKRQTSVKQLNSITLTCDVQGTEAQS